MSYFTKITSLDELKTEYKRLCKIYHPDLNQDKDTTKIMQAINAEYDSMLDSNFADQKEVGKAQREVIEKLVILQGLVIEICGSWIWVSGNTFQNKTDLKEIALKFASKKKMWYWKPSDDNTKRRKTLSIEKIRELHGSQVLYSKGFALAG